MKGVVVTGMGAITPIGNNVVDMWKSMIIESMELHQLHILIQKAFLQ